MWVRRILWSDERIEHVARHGVGRAEVEEVVFGHHFATRVREGRYRVIGQSAGGRYLTIYLAPREDETFKPGAFAVVTARDATEQERRAFRRR